MDPANSKAFEKRAPDPDEIRKLLEAAGHYIKNAAVPGLESTAKFIMAYPATLELATVVLRANGYRFKSSAQGKHEMTFKALKTIFGPEGASFEAFFQKCRKTRNTSQYDEWIDLSDKEAVDLVSEAGKFRDAVVAWLKANHPSLLPPPLPPATSPSQSSP